MNNAGFWAVFYSLLLLSLGNQISLWFITMCLNLYVFRHPATKCETHWRSKSHVLVCRNRLYRDSRQRYHHWRQFPFKLQTNLKEINCSRLTVFSHSFDFKTFRFRYVWIQISNLHWQMLAWNVWLIFVTCIVLIAWIILLTFMNMDLLKILTPQPRSIHLPRKKIGW